MNSKISVILSCLVFFSVKIFSQQCTTLGQTPGTAFPVCGLDTFHQSSVPTCSNGNIYNYHCNDGVTYQDVNPYWYKFTCFKTGSLGFLITPNVLTDDYDWELFDITGRNSNDVYTTQLAVAEAIFVASNWSGNTGADPGYTGVTGTMGNQQLWECASDPPFDNASTFSGMPTIIQGHTYLLMVSHFSGSGQSGYGLSFGGGTASITDTTLPRLSKAIANCMGNQITVSLNKPMQCNSVASNGSDFSILPSVPGISIIGAAGVGCSSGFDMDSVIVTLSQPLPPGNYQVVSKNGSDSNTILDNCNRPVDLNDSIPLSILPLTPTPMDSITPVKCSPDTLQLVFQKNIQCSSVDADGSDFVVTGSFPISVKSASGNGCVNNLSNTIDVVLSAPILNGGNYTITLQKGNDRNTILDECGEETPAGEFINFPAYDTVSATFAYTVLLGCKNDSIQFNHDGRNNVNQWTWVFDGVDTSYRQNPLKIYSVFGNKNAQLLVSNGVCSDTASANISLDNYLKSLFDGPSYLCPNDLGTFKDSSIGQIQNWYWSFGDGVTSNLQDPPPQSYPPTSTREDINYPVELVVENNINCFDTSVNFVKVLYNCYIAVPSAFTPNGDGLNDYLYPLNAYKAQNLQFTVYNRYGQLVFQTHDWQIKWDGKINGNPQPSGTYVWILTYTDGDTGKKVFLKGTSVLIR